MRISSPPTTGPCYYGVDTPTRSELIASENSVDNIRQFITADSLGFLSLKGLHAFRGAAGADGFCDACFSGNYPIPVSDEARARQLVLFEVSGQGRER